MTGWTEKTYVEVANNGKWIRYYQYEFKEKWYHHIVGMKNFCVVGFDTIEKTVNGMSDGHAQVLANPDFEIDGINIVEWFKVAAKGHVKLSFSVTHGRDKQGLRTGETSCLLDVHTSDAVLMAKFIIRFQHNVFPGIGKMTA